MPIERLSFARDREMIFPRHALAEAMLRRLPDPVYKSGLFLSAPRRTGKTTFIRADLVPLMKKAGALVIYADLWEQRSINPARVIISAIQDTILEESGVVRKAAASVGLKKVKLGGLEMDLDAIGSQDGDSLAKTLERLQQATKKPIIMVVDEAQHALSTEEGRDTMFALKAARDALILGGGEGFRFIATGSNSDRLRTLVASKDQAFFGAKEEHLPALDDEYLEWALLRSRFKGHLSLPVMRHAFEMFSRRPEHLQNLFRELEDDPTVDAPNIDGIFIDRAAASMEQTHQAFLAALRQMDALDAAVLRRMARLGEAFTAFDERAIDDYQAMIREADPKSNASRPTKSSVQTALDRLRKDAYVWNAGRGLWYIEDARHILWLRSGPTATSGGPASKSVAPAKPVGTRRRPR